MDYLEYFQVIHKKDHRSCVFSKLFVSTLKMYILAIGIPLKGKKKSSTLQRHDCFRRIDGNIEINTIIPTIERKHVAMQQASARPSLLVRQTR